METKTDNAEDRVVHLHADALCMLQTHAQLTEHEEIMGLIIGFVHNKAVNVVCCLPLIRSDKRPDRVEIEGEQLSAGMQEADRLTADFNTADRKFTVVGWYHSHPHITILPSHVDVHTQKMFEQFDDNSVGLIVSVFNQTDTGLNRVEIGAFQSASSSESTTGESQLDADEALALKLANMSEQEVSRMFEQQEQANSSTVDSKTNQLENPTNAKPKNNAPPQPHVLVDVVIVPAETLPVNQRLAYRQMLLESLKRLPLLVMDELEKDRAATSVSSTLVGLDGRPKQTETPVNAAQYARAHAHLSQLAGQLSAVGEPIIDYMKTLVHAQQ